MQGLIDVLYEACLDLKWKAPSKIQRESIFVALKGNDIIGLAFAGSAAGEEAAHHHRHTWSPRQSLDTHKGVNLKYLVMDEADRILKMDFEVELDKILKVILRERRTFLFSATMTKKVKKLEWKLKIR